MTLLCRWTLESYLIRRGVGRKLVSLPHRIWIHMLTNQLSGLTFLCEWELGQEQKRDPPRPHSCEGKAWSATSASQCSPRPPSCSAALEEALSLSTTSSPGPHQETLLLIGFVGVPQVLEKIEFCEQNAVKENVLGKNVECCYTSKIQNLVILVKSEIVTEVKHALSC